MGRAGGGKNEELGQRIESLECQTQEFKTIEDVVDFLSKRMK